MRIYRIEDAITGRGPWWCDEDDRGATAYDAVRNPDYPSCYSPPNVREDVPDLPSCSCDILCGFLSLAQLECWFGCADGRRAMARRGFEGKIYDVPDGHVWRGAWQCAFDRSAATSLGSFDLETLTEMEHA